MPKSLDLDPLLDLSSAGRFKRFSRRIINIRYLVIAILGHIVFLMVFGQQVVFEAIQKTGFLESYGPLFIPAPKRLPPPPTIQPSQTGYEINPKQSSKSGNMISTRTLTSDFNAPVGISSILSKGPTGMGDQPIKQGDAAQIQKLLAFQQAGVVGANRTPGVTGTGKQTTAEFTCYVAKYQGTGWNFNLGESADGRWYSNCMYNLMFQLRRWTDGRIKARLDPKALDLSSRTWIEKVKPPFIFITGQKYFTFTSAEIESLREYLMLGGVLWVDDAGPTVGSGRGSGFDAAFRREMRRVLPDREFEALPNNHPLFSCYFKLTGPPPGFGSRKDPIETIKIGGEVAVLYTLNSYGNFWTAQLTEKNTIDSTEDQSPSLKRSFSRAGPYFSTKKMSDLRSMNMTQEATVDTYELGANIVIYLLTRFQNDLTVARE